MKAGFEKFRNEKHEKHSISTIKNPTIECEIR